jgi:hypothetical protein
MYFSLRVDGGAAKEEYEHKLEIKNQKIQELEVSNSSTQ